MDVHEGDDGERDLRKPGAAAAEPASEPAPLAAGLVGAASIVLVLLCVIIAAINPQFPDLRQFRPDQPGRAMIPLVLGLGETFIILMGSIDLSVEGVLTLGAVILSMLVLNGANDNDLGLLAVLARAGSSAPASASSTASSMSA